MNKKPMKSKLSLYLTLFLATITVAFLPMTVTAQSSETAADCVSEPEDYISPGSLINMAYGGALKQEGIPGGQVLAAEVRQGSITAEDIVQAAIQGCYLNKKYDIAENDNYVSEVKDEIEVRLRENL